MTVRLSLFGSPTVEYGGESLALPFERRNQLLVFLALKRAWVGRAELAALLWPEQESKLAYTNLRKTLHRLQSLRWARGVESQGGALRFGVETDVFAFDAAIREQRFADALPMRRGELLAGFDDDQSEAWSSWLSFERDRLRLAWRDAAVSRLAGSADVAEGIELSMRLLDADPFDEAALRLHMDWLARGGQSARARQAYQEFVRRLSDDLGLTPGAELVPCTIRLARWRGLLRLLHRHPQQSIKISSAAGRITPDRRVAGAGRLPADKPDGSRRRG